MDMIPNENPRIGKNSDKIGSYEQCFKLITPVINQGDTVEVEQYFTGYGKIDSAKIAFYPSSEIFDKNSSYIISGIHNENGTIRNGGDKQLFDSIGVTIIMRGLQLPSWNTNTQFFDVTGGELPQIYTENKHGYAPFKYELKTNKSIKPGNYSLEFVFTYFNGDSWVSRTKNIDFKVQNFLERYAVQIGVLAILASLSALVRFIVIPMSQVIVELAK